MVAVLDCTAAGTADPTCRTGAADISGTVTVCNCSAIRSADPSCCRRAGDPGIYHAGFGDGSPGSRRSKKTSVRRSIYIQSADPMPLSVKGSGVRFCFRTKGNPWLQRGGILRHGILIDGNIRAQNRTCCRILRQSLCRSVYQSGKPVKVIGGVKLVYPIFHLRLLSTDGTVVADMVMVGSVCILHL